jgi:hypothetical protein
MGFGLNFEVEAVHGSFNSSGDNPPMTQESTYTDKELHYTVPRPLCAIIFKARNVNHICAVHNAMHDALQQPHIAYAELSMLWALRYRAAPQVAWCKELHCTGWLSHGLQCKATTNTNSHSG